MTNVVILSGCRTAIGDYGGALKDVPAVDLGALVGKNAIERAGVTGKDIEHTVIGSVLHGEPRDMYVSRVVSVNAGVPVETPALTLNRLCGSGLQALVTAAQYIELGDARMALAGGVESMSRAGYTLPSLRFGARMNNAEVIDMMVGALSDPFGGGHMGVTAEVVAAKIGISRQQQDEFSVESHRRAARAIAEGRFKSQIIPVELKKRGKVELFDTDEHVRADIDMEQLQKLKTVFKKDGGSVTAGNASGINDGAAAVVLAHADEAKKRGLKALARIVSWGHAGVAPMEMGLGPVSAVPVALKKAGLSVKDMDVIESNEAFAAQACAVSKELGLPADKVNPNGGAVALGHPIGATGAILTVKTLYELQRTGGRYGLITMCIGGGQGIAMVIERL